jgi:uncharacterized membrane protein HdeD (DUF308 family)
MWRLIALRGVLSILFGVLAFFWPGAFWLVVVVTFAAYALLDGILAIAAAVSGHEHGQRWWALLLEGIAGSAAAVICLAWVGIAEVAFMYVLAAWAVLSGIFEIAAAVRLRHYIRGEWLLALSGALSIILGVALALMPGVALLVIAWWVAAYAIAFGVLLLALAFRLRALVRETGSRREAMAAR